LIVLFPPNNAIAMPATATLILETSTPHASLAMVAPDGSWAEREFTSDRSHQACVFGPLADLLASCAVDSIGRVLVGSGPGSYSGTRVGIAAAQGVAIASECQALALPSILAVPAADGGAACLAIGDARRGSFWTARIAAHQMVEEPALTDTAGLIAAVASAVDQGMAVVSFEEPARFHLPVELAAAVRLEFPSAARLWRAWCLAAEEMRAAWTLAAPQPIYLKPPHITPARRPWLVSS
jgi:tRNA threonylcarbamoyl adenosine modification protein YeaZ